MVGELWQRLTDNPLVMLGIMLVVGAGAGRLTRLIRMPSITGQILVGIALGPQLSGVIDASMLPHLHNFSTVAIGVIAFRIGSEFDRALLQRLGPRIVGLTIGQFLGAFVLVLITMEVLRLDWPYALLLAAIAISTAPTTTAALVRDSGVRRGPFVSYLLGIIALNDTLAVIMFSVMSTAVADRLQPMHAHAPLVATAFRTFGAELLALGVGGGIGAAFVCALRLASRNRELGGPSLELLLLGFGLVAVGSAAATSLSFLLVPLAFGLMVANTLPAHETQRVRNLLGPYAEPLFVVFFVLAGAHLPIVDAHGLQALGLAFAYVTARFAGKYLGARLAARSLRLPGSIERYLGLSLAIQGGLVLGLILAFRGSPPVAALAPSAHQAIESMTAVVLLGVLLTQLAGPPIVRLALQRGADPGSSKRPGQGVPLSD
jgi:Kef-type K+ transport system membrane component KefB